MHAVTARYVKLLVVVGKLVVTNKLRRAARDKLLVKHKVFQSSVGSPSLQPSITPDKESFLIIPSLDVMAKGNLNLIAARESI